MKRRVTLTDVAKKAGVHVTTVSLALRNHRSLPLTTRERLQELADKMGYRSEPLWRALAGYRQSPSQRDSPVMAYVTGWKTRLGWKRIHPHARMFIGATAKARALGYKLEHFWASEPRLAGQGMNDLFRERGINGLILASQLPTEITQFTFDWTRLSAVKIDYHPRQLELHKVTNDQRAIIQLAVSRALASGYRRIGFALPRHWDDLADLSWSAGFLSSQQNLAIEDRIPMFLFSEPDSGTLGLDRALGRPTTTETFKSWFQRYRPEVLISLKASAAKYLAELKLSIPRDLAFIELYLQGAAGETAGIRQNCYHVGELAVELLAGRLQQQKYGIPDFPAASLVEGSWYDGKSLPDRSLFSGRVDRLKYRKSV